MSRLPLFLKAAVLLLFLSAGAAAAYASFDSGRRAVPREHPRLLGSIERLRSLAKERPEAYARMANVARTQPGKDYPNLLSMALTAAIEGDGKLGRDAVRFAMEYVNAPIRSGHVTFGYDLAYTALVYDLCWPWWTGEERREYGDYLNRTVDANVQSEPHVFHNAWYGYKHWGYGLACYATFYENPRAEEILRTTERDYLDRAAPALKLAGNGGGWAEGYYVHYWTYEWLFFCEAARFCEGLDYYAAAPEFYHNRAVASMFEVFPGIGEYGTRRPVPMGDGGGRVFGGDRDKVLSARRILVNFYRDDPAHRAAHAFNETTPRSGVSVYAYKDFLWRDETVSKGDLKRFRLSYFSPGAGYVYARSSWEDDATYFFFKCGDRFTAHQHLDNGHFLIYKHAELAGDGGHYDEFGTPHDVNYHLRTIAHSTLLVKDPAETWRPDIRAGKVEVNDGGQAHPWAHRNGAAADPAEWNAGRAGFDIADILAFEDRGDYLYVAGDCTRSYSPRKLDRFTRQVVFIRPGTFVIFDRVRSKDPAFVKTWLLQAMKTPRGKAPELVVSNGGGKLFIQTLLPRAPKVKLVSGPELYTVEGKNFPPSRETGPAPECRIEVSPGKPAREDCFLHILTAADSTVTAVPRASVRETAREVTVSLDGAKLVFPKDRVGGSIGMRGKKTAALVEKVIAE